MTYKRASVETFYARTTRKILCPCGAVLMPSIKPGYHIVEVDMLGNTPSEILIKCNRCSTQYRIMLDIGTYDWEDYY